MDNRDEKQLIVYAIGLVVSIAIAFIIGIVLAHR